MSQILTVGSLFSGIGGLDLGLERTGRFHVAWQVEIDDYCQQVLSKHWPHVTRFRDVRSCGVHNLSKVDLMCGGFPCQDISNAGKGAGLEGERSGLWFEYARLLCEFRPTYVIVENVAALVQRGLSRVLADLAALGYDSEWQVLPAAAFGAPHRRERIFIVAYLSGIRGNTWGTQSEEQQRKTHIDSDRTYVPDSDGHRQWKREGEPQRVITCSNASDVGNDGTQEPMAYSNFQRAQVSSARIFPTEYVPERSRWWATEPDVGRVAHGVPSRVDRLKGLGNAVVPQVAYYVGSCVIAWHDSQVVNKPS